MMTSVFESKTLAFETETKMMTSVFESKTLDFETKAKMMTNVFETKTDTKTVVFGLGQDQDCDFWSQG